MFTALNLPNANLKLTRKENDIFVWCIVRNKKLLATPEEWVRQHIIHYLINQLQIPAGVIASEYGIKVNNQTRRCDVLVFDLNKNPVVLVECKAPQVVLNEKVVDQIVQYDSMLGVEYLWISNGIQHFLFQKNKESNSYSQIKVLPAWHFLNQN
jgi:hypothetical protein